MKKFTNIMAALFLTALFFGCGSDEKVVTKSAGDNAAAVSGKHYNISILIDLSDRISPALNPAQRSKDISLIMNIVKEFKKRLNIKGTFAVKDKIRVIFYPQPRGFDVNAIADNMNFDFEQIPVEARKKVFSQMDSIYEASLNLLYDKIAEKDKYDGSDLFNFFKSRAEDDCVMDNLTYDNVLVVLTDGYLYWKSFIQNKENRFSYLLPTAGHVTKFRRNPDWEKVFSEGDYGFLPINSRLKNLRVIAAEFNPVETAPEDFDIMSAYWSKWFDEMGLEKSSYKILKSDLNTTTRAAITRFLFN